MKVNPDVDLDAIARRQSQPSGSGAALAVGALGTVLGGAALVTAIVALSKAKRSDRDLDHDQVKRVQILNRLKQLEADVNDMDFDVRQLQNKGG